MSIFAIFRADFDYDFQKKIVEYDICTNKKLRILKKKCIPEPWWTLEMTNRIDLFIMERSL